MLDNAGTAGGAKSAGSVGTAGSGVTVGSGRTAGGIPSRGRPYDVVRALLRPLFRTLPRRTLVAGAVLGLLFTGIPRLFALPIDVWAGLNLLRAAALTFALGLAFLLDDPARHITTAVPTRRPVRVGLRVALVAPSAVLWWTAALFLIPEQARPPMGAMTLEATATAVLALAAAAVMVRFGDRAEPGVWCASDYWPRRWWRPCCSPTGGRSSPCRPTRAGTAPTRHGRWSWSPRRWPGRGPAWNPYGGGGPQPSLTGDTKTRARTDGQDSLRYIRSVSCVRKPSRSYTVTAALLSAST